MPVDPNVPRLSANGGSLDPVRVATALTRSVSIDGGANHVLRHDDVSLVLPQINNNGDLL